MANYTTNLELEKPLESEAYDIKVFNRNMDTIDAEVAKKLNKEHKATSDEVKNGINDSKYVTPVSVKVAITAAITETEKSINESIQAITEIPDGGTAGQILTKKSDSDKDVEWSDPINKIKNYLNVRSKEIQALSTQFQEVKLNTIVSANGNLFTLDNNRIICKENGTVLIFCRIFCAEGFNNNDNIRLAIFKNDTNVYANAQCIVGSYNTITMIATLDVKNGDIISLHAMNYSGARGSIGNVGELYGNTFNVRYIN